MLSANHVYSIPVTAELFDAVNHAFDELCFKKKSADQGFNT